MFFSDFFRGEDLRACEFTYDGTFYCTDRRRWRGPEICDKAASTRGVARDRGG